MQEQLKALPISDIYPNPFQPRIEFSDEELAEHKSNRLQKWTDTANHCPKIGYYWL